MPACNESMPWRTLDVLPIHDVDDWAIWRGKKSIVLRDFNEVVAAVKGWQPQSPVLVGVPGAPRFVPPIFVEALSKPILKTIKQNHFRLMVGFFIPAMLFLAYALVSFSMAALPWALSFLMVPLMLAFDYALSLRYRQSIMERALFFFWFYTSKTVRFAFSFWVSTGLVIGGLQLFLQSDLGGIEALFHRYGVMYQDVRNGEIWRLFSGPFFHYSLQHFIINFCLLAMVGTLTWSMLGAVSAIIFLFGNMVGALVQMNLGGQLFDNCGGVSFGIYALFGLLIASSVLNKKLLPRGLILLCMFVAMMGMVSSELLSETAATAGHLGGLIFGAVSAAVILFYSKLFNSRNICNSPVQK